MDSNDKMNIKDNKEQQAGRAHEQDIEQKQRHEQRHGQKLRLGQGGRHAPDEPPEEVLPVGGCEDQEEAAADHHDPRQLHPWVTGGKLGVMERWREGGGLAMKGCPVPQPVTPWATQMLHRLWCD